MAACKRIHQSSLRLVLSSTASVFFAQNLAFSPWREISYWTTERNPSPLPKASVFDPREKIGSRRINQHESYDKLNCIRILIGSIGGQTHTVQMTKPIATFFFLSCKTNRINIVMFPCPVMDNRRGHSAVRTSVTHSAAPRVPLFSYRTHLWSLTEQKHGNIKYNFYNP